MRTLDFSKGRALHNLYGHSVFLMEAQKAGKDARFAENVCFNVKCNGQTETWRTALPTHI